MWVWFWDVMVAVDLWFRFIDVVLGVFGCGLRVGLLG